jgi:alpha-amylase
MATKFFSDGAVHAYFNPYDTPYDAFMNYMNVLSDFEIRLNRFIPDNNEQNEISKLNNLIKEKESVIDQLSTEIDILKHNSRRKKTTASGKLLSAKKSPGKTKTTKRTKS